MGIVIKELKAINHEIMRQVDRSENVESVYVGRPLTSGLGLELQKIPQDPIMTLQPWSEEGIARRIQNWQPEIEKGGHLLAALNGDKVVGFGIIGPTQSDESIELCALFVSSEMRQSGIGSILFRQLEKIAKKETAKSLLIYANPTSSSVDFYRKQNCAIIGVVDKRLVSHLPLDVIFAKPL